MPDQPEYDAEEYARLHDDLVSGRDQWGGKAEILLSALRFASLRDEIVEALKPFAFLPIPNEQDGRAPANEIYHIDYIQVGDFRRAAAILSRIKDGVD